MILAAKADAEAIDWTRTERGSLEGEVLSVTHDQSRTEVVVRARLSGRDVTCMLTGNAGRPGHAFHGDDIWTGRRVLVAGVCHFDRKGDLVRVDAEDVTEIVSRPVELNDLRDPGFSNGRTAREHADAVWGDDA